MRQFISNNKICRKNEIGFILLILFILVIFVSILSNNNLFFASAKVSDTYFTDKITDGGGTTRKTFRPAVTQEHFDEVNAYANKVDGYITAYNSLTIPTLACPDPSKNFNNLDNLIYMVKRLEKFAENYTYSNNTRQNINNLTLGFIRTINKNYDGQGASDNFLDELTWDIICGNSDFNFNLYVSSNETSFDLTADQFFSSYLESINDYNYESHSHFPLCLKYELTDPLGSGQTIDLIHLFAAIDGIYSHTDNNNLICKTVLGNDSYQKDLISWLGDLHTFTNQVADSNPDLNKLKTYNNSYGHIDFNEFVGNDADSFSSSDLLADIDAFNIVNFYLNNNVNSLSNAIIAYYTTIQPDSSLIGNRYYAFIYNVTVETQLPKTGNLLKDFQNEIFSSLNLDYNNGNIIDKEYYSKNSVNLKLLTGSYLDNSTYPSFEIRRYCANLFYSYIVEMSNRF